MSMFEQGENMNLLGSNIDTLNQTIDNNVQEGVRLIARGVMSKNVYTLRGGKEAKGTKEMLHQKLNSLGVKV